MTFTLATLDHDGPVACLGTGDSYWPLDAAAKAAGLQGLPSTLMAVMDGWDSAFPLLEALSQKCGAGAVPSALAVPRRAARFLTPLHYPRKLICAGANYHDHLKEMNVAFERRPGDLPFFFLKPPTTTLVGPGKTTRMAVDCEKLDWEIELAVVIARRARHVPVEKALEYAAAYTIAIDMSARDIIPQPDTIFKFNFFAGKGQDTACPLGPELVPATFVGDPQRLHLTLSVNGQVKQNADASLMIFNVAEQISGASRYVTLEPGDIILTGTPAGVGAGKGEFLKVGDKMSATITKLGSLDVEIVPSDLG